MGHSTSETVLQKEANSITVDGSQHFRKTVLQREKEIKREKEKKRERERERERERKREKKKERERERKGREREKERAHEQDSERYAESKSLCTISVRKCMRETCLLFGTPFWTVVGNGACAAAGTTEGLLSLASLAPF